MAKVVNFTIKREDLVAVLEALEQACSLREASALDLKRPWGHVPTRLPYAPQCLPHLGSLAECSPRAAQAGGWGAQSGEGLSLPVPPPAASSPSCPRFSAGSPTPPKNVVTFVSFGLFFFFLNLTEGFLVVVVGLAGIQEREAIAYSCFFLIRSWCGYFLIVAFI